MRASAKKSRAAHPSSPAGTGAIIASVRQLLQSSYAAPGMSKVSPVAMPLAVLAWSSARAHVRPDSAELVSSGAPSGRLLDADAPSTTLIDAAESGSVMGLAKTGDVLAAPVCKVLRSTGDIGFMFLWFTLHFPGKLLIAHKRNDGARPGLRVATFWPQPASFTSRWGCARPENETKASEPRGASAMLLEARSPSQAVVRLISTRRQDHTMPSSRRQQTPRHSAVLRHAGRRPPTCPRALPRWRRSQGSTTHLGR